MLWGKHCEVQWRRSATAQPKCQVGACSARLICRETTVHPPLPETSMRCADAQPLREDTPPPAGSNQTHESSGCFGKHGPDSRVSQPQVIFKCIHFSTVGQPPPGPPAAFTIRALFPHLNFTVPTGHRHLPFPSRLEPFKTEKPHEHISKTFQPPDRTNLPRAANRQQKPGSFIREKLESIRMQLSLPSKGERQTHTSQLVASLIVNQKMIVNRVRLHF